MKSEFAEPQVGQEDFAEKVTWQIRNKPSHQYQVIMDVHSQRSLAIEIGTGAADCSIYQGTKKELFPSPQLDKFSSFANIHQSESVSVMGQMEVELKYGGYAVRAHLTLWEGTTSHICHTLSIPFAIKETNGRKLDQLETADILWRVNHSD